MHWKLSVVIPLNVRLFAEAYRAADMYNSTTTDALGESDQLYRTAWPGLWCRGCCAAEVGRGEHKTVVAELSSLRRFLAALQSRATRQF